MIDDILFYTTVYVSLFVSVFWLLVFLGNKETKRKSLKKLPSLSVIIPAHNEEHHLENCVESLIGQDYPGLKIIIVDDGSTDSTAEAGKRLSRKYSFIRYIRKENRGKAAALNTGLSTVNSKFFGFIDADTSLSKNALRNMMAYFSSDAAAVIAVIKPVEPRNFVERIQKIEYMIASFTRKLMSFLNSLYYTPGFALYKTEIVKKLGGFDEDNLTEDLEIGLRLKDNGYRIENTAEDYAYTVVPKTMHDLFDQRMRWYRGHIYNTKKYSHMFFSKKHGDLGIFILPIQYILLAVTSPFLVLGIYDFLLALAKNIIDIKLVGYDFLYFFGTASFNFINPFTFFVVTLFATFLLILKVSERQIKEKISPFEYALYMIVYPFINLFLWIAAFTQEMLRTKKKW
ncbi:MAG: glycosyltransferase family 2 protein [Candidatus Aenigmarchaeota archaeon]|nr:glycosyltransferase family 2 protein [Candidatus Aenigmarchaeota archaeon]